MNFTSLRYFLVVTQTQNFSKAADKLFISQQALSKCVHGLEAELGVKLFNRGKKTTLTYAGMRFATYASSIVNLSDAMLQEMQHLQAQDKGRVYVTVNETRASALMPVVLERFYQKYPFVEVSLIEGDAVRVSDSILTNDAHFGIGLGLTKAGILTEKIMDEKLCVMIPQKYAQSLRASMPDDPAATGGQIDIRILKDIPFIMLNKTMFIRQWTDEYLAHCGINPNILFEATSVQTLLSMVRQGLGITLCTESFLYSFQSEPENNSIMVYPLYDAGTRALGIFYRSNYTMTPYSAYLVSLIHQYYRNRSVEYWNGKVIINIMGDV